MGRNPPAKRHHPDRGVKRGSGGGVVLGKKMLGRKREADIQKTDPKLQQTVSVKITRSERLDELGLKLSGKGGNTQRKKVPVLKPPAPRPRPPTIYKARILSSTTRKTHLKSRHHPPNPPVPAQKPPAKVTAKRQKRSTVQEEVNTQRKVVARKARKGGAHAVAVKTKVKILKSVGGVKGTKGLSHPKSKRGKPVGTTRKRGAGGTKVDGGGSGAKKLKLSIPKEKFLLSLVADFDIILHRTPRIEALAMALNKMKPILPLLNASPPKRVEQSESPVPGTSHTLPIPQNENPGEDVLTRGESEAVEVVNVGSDLGVDMISLLQECQNADQVDWVPSYPGSVVDLDSVQAEVELIAPVETDVSALPTQPVPPPSVPPKENDLVNGVEEPLEEDVEEVEEDVDVIGHERNEVKDPLAQDEIDLADYVVEDAEFEEEETEEVEGNMDDMIVNDNVEEEDEDEMDTFLGRVDLNPTTEPEIPINYGGNLIRDALAAKQNK